jgi:arabinofuranosyltransferase
MGHSSETSRPPRRLSWPSLAALVIAVLIVIRTAWGYVPFVADDALISFRYSQRLLAGQGLTFTSGDAVEGYSNLLWVLLIAGGGLFSSDLILVGRVLGLVCATLSLAAILWACPIRSWASALAACTGLAAIALSRGTAIWAIGGLEQALQGALLAWALALISHRPLRNHADDDGFDESPPDDVPIVCGGVLALLVLTRPDGALITALVAAGLLAVHGGSIRTLRGVLRLSWLPAAAWLAHEGFRLWYYGDWIPNTAYAKVAGSLQHVRAGLEYLDGAVIPHLPILLLTFGAILVARPLRRRDVLVPLTVLIGWSAYIDFVGGDIFPGRRHILPVLVSLAFLLVGLIRRLATRQPRLTTAACVVACVTYVPLQARDIQNDRARTERWEWDCAALMGDLRAVWGTQQPLLAADAIGCTGYFSSFPMLDMLGLTDRYLAHHRPPDFGSGFIGHELGDGGYVLGREPDLIIFGLTGSPTPWFRSGLELVKLPAFMQGYVPVVIKTFGVPPAQLWMRWASPRIGVRRSANEIHIPGVLFAAPDAAQARRLHDRLVVRIPAGRTVAFDRMLLEPDNWTGRAIGSGSPAAVAVDRSAIHVTAGATDSEIAEVVLTRP